MNTKDIVRLLLPAVITSSRVKRVVADVSPRRDRSGAHRIAEPVT